MPVCHVIQGNDLFIKEGMDVFLIVLHLHSPYTKCTIVQYNDNVHVILIHGFCLIFAKNRKFINKIPIQLQPDGANI